MKQIQKTLLTTITLTMIFLIFPSKAMAAVSCDLIEWNEENRTIYACVNGFATEQELQNSSVTYKCTENSNKDSGVVGALGLPTLCLGQNKTTISLSGIQTEQKADGTYTTCFTSGGLPRGWGTVDFQINGDTCISDIDTKPADFDATEEGMLWQGEQASQTNGIRVKRIAAAECDDSSEENVILDTAIGCIPTGPQAFIEWLFKTALGFAGGIAFLIMAAGAFTFMTSNGNPEQIKKGKDMIVSALTGLLFIIFSVFLLRIIGVNILQIPGFQ